jgi:hypothetical protein
LPWNEVAALKARLTHEREMFELRATRPRHRYKNFPNGLVQDLGADEDIAATITAPQTDPHLPAEPDSDPYFAPAAGVTVTRSSNRPRRAREA